MPCLPACLPACSPASLHTIISSQLNSTHIHQHRQATYGTSRIKQATKSRQFQLLIIVIVSTYHLPQLPEPINPKEKTEDHLLVLLTDDRSNDQPAKAHSQIRIQITTTILIANSITIFIQRAGQGRAGRSGHL